MMGGLLGRVGGVWGGVRGGVELVGSIAAGILGLLDDVKTLVL